MNGFSARFVLPLLASATLTATNLFGQKTEKSLPEREHSTLTYIHGAEYPDELYKTRRRMESMRDLMHWDSAHVTGRIIGDGKNALELDSIGAGIAKLKSDSADLHNIIVFFHGTPVADTLNGKVYPKEQLLKNTGLKKDVDSLDIKAVDFFRTVGKNLSEVAEQKDRIRMRYIPCFGMSGVFGMGYLPPETHVWVGSSARTPTWDHYEAMNVALSPLGRNPDLPEDRLIQTSIMIQNFAASAANEHSWNKENFVVIVTDKQTNEEKTEFGPNELRIIDLHAQSVAMLNDFSFDDIEKALCGNQSFVTSAMRTSYFSRSRAKDIPDLDIKADPHAVHENFDYSLVDKTIAKLRQVKSAEQYDTLLNDTEKHMANLAAYTLYSRRENWGKLPTAAAFQQQNNVHFVPGYSEP